MIKKINMTMYDVSQANSKKMIEAEKKHESEINSVHSEHEMLKMEYDALKDQYEEVHRHCEVLKMNVRTIFASFNCYHYH